MAQEEFLIVGLGASAGGIRAFREFFRHVPENSGAAYVVILHLSPEHDSRLAEVLQVATTMPVRQVQDRVSVEPDHVYVIPPSQSLEMMDGFLALSPLLRLEERRAPVDIFFRTLAETHGRRAVSVVLSGTGADGSMGMKRVKECGGVCFVQDPDEAEHADMPRACIATALVDQVLKVAEIPGRIMAYQTDPPGDPARGRAATSPSSPTKWGCARSSACCASAPATTSSTTSARRCSAGSSGAWGCTAFPTSAATPCSCAITRPKRRPSSRIS